MKTLTGPIRQCLPPNIREAIHLLGEMEQDARCDRMSWLANDLAMYRQNLLWLLPEVIASNGKGLVDTVTGMRFDLERPRKLIPREQVVERVIAIWEKDRRGYRFRNLMTT